MNKISYLIFIVLSVTITYFLGDGAKNMLLICFMAITPVLLFYSKVKFDSVDTLMFIFIVSLTIVNMMHSDTFRVLSYAYTICFVTTFLFLRSAINRGFFQLELTIRMLKWLIYSYAIVLVLQQLSVATGAPMINPGPIEEDNPWKLASLAPESSHLVRFVFFLMYAYIELRDIQIGGGYSKANALQDRPVWFSYFWIMLTCVSTTGFLLVFLLFTKFFSIRTLFKYVLLCIPIWFCFNVIFSDSSAFMRVGTFVKAMMTFDFDMINAADHSAAYRIVPFFAYFEGISFLSPEFWIGMGMDSGRHICQQFMAVSSNDMSYVENDVNVGGMMAFIIDNGIIVMMMLFLAIRSFLKNINNKSLVVVWLLFSFVEGVNMQMFWSSLILMYMVSYFTEIHNQHKCLNKQQNY